MRFVPLIALVVLGLLALAALPVGFAQTTTRAGLYLPLVFKAVAVTPSVTPSTPPLQTATASGTATPTHGATSTVTPTVTTGTGSGFPSLPPGVPTRTKTTKPIFTNGLDVWNCGDFGSWDDAQVVYRANQPGDPNKLDQNNDGSACDSLRP